MDELACALDEIAILPPAALGKISTIRRIHARLTDAGCVNVITEPCEDVHARATNADVERLHEIFDACVAGGAPSVPTHYADEACVDESFVSDDGVEAYVRDGECVLAWAMRALKNASTRLDGSSGRPDEARASAAEDATRTLDALRRTTETLGADASGRTAGEVAPQFKRLQSVRDEVVCRQLQAEALLWAARSGLSSGAVGAAHGGPAAWAGAVQRRRAAAQECSSDGRFGGPMSTFLDDLLAGVGEHKPAYPFKTVSEAARSVFVEGDASPTALIAKRCLFLYFLLDSGLPHDGAPLDYARQARIHPRLFMETRAAVLLDDMANEAALDEACALLPQIAHPLLPVKFIASLAKRGRSATALMVARARAPHGALATTPDAETMALDVSIRLDCDLVAEAFVAARDSFKLLPKLHEVKTGRYLVSLLLDHGVRQLCLDNILALPFYGEMEKILLELLWERRESVPIETGVEYLLNRGRALEAASLYTKAKEEGRLDAQRTVKLKARLEENLAQLPVPQKVLARDAATDAKDASVILPRRLVVESSTDLSSTVSALVTQTEPRAFNAIVRPASEDAAGPTPFVRPPIELARDDGDFGDDEDPSASSARDSPLDRATAAFASTSILGSPGRASAWMPPAAPAADASPARGAAQSPIQSLSTPSTARRVVARGVPEPTAYASPFGGLRPASTPAETTTTRANASDNPNAETSGAPASGSLLFAGTASTPSRGIRRPMSVSSAFPAFMSPAPRRPAGADDASRRA